MIIAQLTGVVLSLQTELHSLSISLNITGSLEALAYNKKVCTVTTQRYKYGVSTRVRLGTFYFLWELLNRKQTRPDLRKWAVARSGKATGKKLNSSASHSSTKHKTDFLRGEGSSALMACKVLRPLLLLALKSVIKHNVYRGNPQVVVRRSKFENFLVAVNFFELQ